MKNGMNIRFLVTTAVFIAIAIVLRSFAINVAVGGTLTMRVSFDAICYIVPGLLFGSLYGGIAGGLIDVLGYIIRPMGGYIPLFTITNIAAGILPAILWKGIGNIDKHKIRNYYSIFFALVFLIGFVNFIVIRFMPNTVLNKLLMFLGKKSQYLSFGFMVIGSIGILIFIINLLINKNSGKLYMVINNNYFKMVIVLGISGIVICTINTYILLIFTPALMVKGFIFLWIPRIIETLLMTIINSYIICIILYSYDLFYGRVVKKA
ncbi:folate family ECF transporter S component [Clostridium sp. WILCCON 0269]|uniref:Folate family ECF transporter S component n=1 Tax=Candidatus Clostridium eludens TaxID=3381663 RepID=A0ABW8SKU6_9CLOT